MLQMLLQLDDTSYDVWLCDPETPEVETLFSYLATLRLLLLFVALQCDMCTHLELLLTNRRLIVLTDRRMFSRFKQSKD